MSNTDERSITMLKRGNKGFTLIELITVMVILGVLAAYAVPKLFDFTGTAKTKTRSQFRVEINSALRMYGLQQLASSGAKAYPGVTGMVLGDLIDEASAELSFSAADSTFKYDGNGDADFTDSGVDYTMSYSCVSPFTSYTLGQWTVLP